MTTNQSYLIHHGILGQKWGVRRYQNKDGTLTEEGKKHKDAYVKANLLARQVAYEGQKLLNQDEKLRRDFGNSYSNIDDDEYLELVAREYGHNTDAFWNANKSYKSFVKENRDSIQKGAEIIRNLIEQEKRKKLEEYMYTDIHNN